MAKLFTHQLVRNQEINQFKSTITDLVKQIQDARTFIKEIESGNLEIDFKNTSANGEDEHLLAASLLSMRDQMRKIAREEKQRNWATEGLAKFVDILRSNNDDLLHLGDQIIRNIVKYMNANQGSLYILDDSEGDPFLELIACYAYDRKKHINKRIGIGEGLVGQCVLEKGTMYMTNLPQDYLKITSGLGEALPKNLLIVPLLLNDRVYGVIELASFSAFEKHHRDFIEKLAESIASTISNARVNEQTKKLLRETQEQTETMRSQEEEMRQNMEELAATQEEMQRILREVEGKEAYLNQLLNVSVDSIFTVDKEYRLVSWNKAFATTLEQFGMKLQKGANTLDWYQGEEKKNQIDTYNRVFRGESFDFTASSVQNGKTYYHLSIYAPLRNTDGEVYEAAVFAKDITAMMNAQKRAEKLAAEAQEKTEEMKAQEEELRQNMEELSATQEEMQRILNEVQSKEAYLNALLNASKDSIFTVDKDLRLISFNDAFSIGLKQIGLNVEKGFYVIDIFQGQQKVDQVNYYQRAFNGEVFETTSEYDINGVVSYFNSSFHPLRNEQNEIYAVAVFGKDLTELMTAKNKAEKLANEAVEKTEEMRAQEEALRENMKELSATQSEMQRILNEVREQEAYLKAVLNSTKDSVFTVDRDLKLISFNDGFSAGLKQVGLNVEKGFNIIDIFPENQKAAQKGFYQRAFNGETFDVTNEYEFSGLVTYYNSAFSPIRDGQNEIYAVAVFGKDLTELMTAKNKAEQAAKEAQEKTEEVKAQEEELRQNMEELSATQEEMQRIMSELESKSAYATSLLDASDDMVFTVDTDYRLVTWNKTFEQMMKVYGQVVNKGFNTLDWYPEGQQRKDQVNVYKRVFKGEAFSSSFTSENNGQILHFKNTYKPLFNDKGEVYEAVLFTRSVSEAEGSPVVSKPDNGQMFMVDIINTCKHVVYTVDNQEKLLYFNEAFDKMAQLLGAEAKIGTNVFQSMSDKKAVKAIRANLQRVLKGEALEQVQEFVHGNATTYLWMHYRPVKDDKGEIIAAGIYGENITELMSLKKTNSLLMKQIENQN